MDEDPFPVVVRTKGVDLWDWLVNRQAKHKMVQHWVIKKPKDE